MAYDSYANPKIEPDRYKVVVIVNRTHKGLTDESKIQVTETTPEAALERVTRLVNALIPNINDKS